MKPARLLSCEPLDVRQKGDHVVPGDLLDLVDGVRVELLAKRSDFVRGSGGNDPGVLHGLTPGGDGCEVKVDPGCGLTIDVNQKIAVDPGQLAGNGIKFGPDCLLRVNVGCGLEIVNDTVQVDNADLAGPVNLTAPEETTSKGFARALGEHLVQQ